MENRLALDNHPVNLIHARTKCRARPFKRAINTACKMGQYIERTFCVRLLIEVRMKLTKAV